MGAPFVKWAGGKRRLVPFVAQHVLGSASAVATADHADGTEPGDRPERAKRAGRLVEPFAGGAALSLALADRFDRLWLNDVNADLMKVYSFVQTKTDKYIEAVRDLFRPENNTEEAYYRLRDQFNATESPWEKATLFLYLNRHGYNGLCRYNASGGFNVPFGRYARPYFPERELRAAAGVLQKARLTNVDFEAVLSRCSAGDIVYCDPPYVPLSSTSSFTDYASAGFTADDQKRLVRAARAAQSRGAFVAISNHDTPLTRKLYKEAECHFERVRRTISCDGQNRNKVTEVLALFKP